MGEKQYNDSSALAWALVVVLLIISTFVTWKLGSTQKELNYAQSQVKPCMSGNEKTSNQIEENKLLQEAYKEIVIICRTKQAPFEFCYNMAPLFEWGYEHGLYETRKPPLSCPTSYNKFTCYKLSNGVVVPLCVQYNESAFADISVIDAIPQYLNVTTSTGYSTTLKDATVVNCSDYFEVERYSKEEIDCQSCKEKIAGYNDPHIGVCYSINAISLPIETVNKIADIPPLVCINKDDLDNWCKNRS